MFFDHNQIKLRCQTDPKIVVTILSKNFLFNFKDGGILKDNSEKVFKTHIKRTLTSKIDMIITIGAVSAGKFDFVPKIVSEFKSSAFFKNVAIRPGKPILFSKLKNKVIFGLPGNPISSAACFRFFVYPYLLNILNIKEEKSYKEALWPLTSIKILIPFYHRKYHIYIVYQEEGVYVSHYEGKQMITPLPT